jgi:hypothetical protein
MFTLAQVLWLVVLFMIFAGLASGWIMFMVGVNGATRESDRRVEAAMYGVEQSIEEANAYYRNEKARRQIAETAHEEALLKVLRGGEILGNEFSVEHSADWATGSDRKVETFNNVLEFLNCIDNCRQQGRTVWYTRVGSLILSN